MSKDMCDPDVYQNGEPIYMTADVSTEFLNRWVEKVAKSSKQKVDWSWGGGRAVIKFLGNRKSVLSAIQKHYLELRDEVYNEFKRAGLESLFTEGHVGRYL